MADRYAVTSGNWSNTATWDGGTLPQIGDVVRANGFTVTIDISINVLELRTTALVPAVVGGKFIINNGVTVSANLINGSNNSFEFNLPSPNSCTIIGNLTCPSINVLNLLLISNSGTVNIVGDLFPNINSQPIVITGGGSIVNITGNLIGNLSGGYSINVNANSNITIIGQVTGGAVNPSQAINVGGSPLINITGQVIAGAVSPAIQMGASTSTIIINGQVIGGSGVHAVAGTSTSSNVVIDGNIINSIGTMAVFVPKVFIGPSVSSWQFTQFDLTTVRTLYSADALPGTPPTSDVRQGTIYGAGGSLTGTLEVPPTSSVAVGVPVDNTVGTAMISITDMGALLSSYVV